MCRNFIDSELRMFLDVDLICTSNLGRRLELILPGTVIVASMPLSSRSTCRCLEGVTYTTSNGVYISITKIFFLGVETHLIMVTW